LLSASFPTLYVPTPGLLTGYPSKGSCLGPKPKLVPTLVKNPYAFYYPGTDKPKV
jgi:hypothetical protein